MVHILRLGAVASLTALEEREGHTCRQVTVGLFSNHQWNDLLRG